MREEEEGGTIEEWRDERVTARMSGASASSARQTAIDDDLRLTPSLTTIRRLF